MNKAVRVKGNVVRVKTKASGQCSQGQLDTSIAQTGKVGGHQDDDSAVRMKMTRGGVKNPVIKAMVTSAG